MQPRLLLLLLLLCCLLVATTSTTSAAQQSVNLCPDVTPGVDKALRLVVSNTNNITLPNGRKLQRGLTYNNSYVGPLITADLGNQISVDVANHADVGTSVHWHGMDLPDAAWADGVDAVTQRPIPPGETFRYKFKAEPAGTLWYHSHVGMQFADGLRGPLIVADPDDPYKDAYDEEVVLLFTDQNSESGEEELKALQEGTASMSMGVCTNVSSQDWSDAPFTTILTNGKGFMLDPATRKPVGIPYVIKVQQGKRYRMRAIQGAASWGLKVKAPPGHSMTVIALDGSNVAATPAKGFVFTPGERVDFILHANQSVGNYWMDVATLPGNNSPVLISYQGADARTAVSPRLSLGCDWALPEKGVLDFKNDTLQPHATVPAPPPGKPNMTLVVYLANNADPAQSMSAVLGSGKSADDIPGMQGNSTTVRPQEGCVTLPDGRRSAYCWTLNWVQFEGGSNGVPLLFPDAERNGTRTYIQEVPFGAVVDVVFINPGAMLHPMHLHGQRFWVLGAGNAALADILTPQGQVDYAKLNTTSRPVMRDTQPVANAIPITAATARSGSGAASTNTSTSSPTATKAGPPSPRSPGASSHVGPAVSSRANASITPGSTAPRPKQLTRATPGSHGRRHLLQQQPPPPPAAAMPDMAASAPGPATTTAAPKAAGVKPQVDRLDTMPGMEAMPAAAAAPAAMPAAAVTASAPPSAMSTTGSMAMGQASMGTKMGAATSGTMGAASGSSGNSMGGMAEDQRPAVPMVPGYSVIRFKANNPGMWALHCHIDLHANSGMMMVMKVAAADAREPWSLPKGVTACGAQQNMTKLADTAAAAQTSATASNTPLAARSAAAAAPQAVSLLLWLQFITTALLTVWMIP